MMIGPPLVIAPSHGSAIDSVSGRAVIAYQSWTDDTDAIYSASTEAAASGSETYVADNAFDGLTYDYWKASASGTGWVQFQLGSSKVADYFGVAAHNLGTIGATARLLGSTDGSNFTLVTDYIPATDLPFCRLFDSVGYIYWRLEIVGGSAAPQVGVFMCGPRLSLQRSIFVGHRPATFARDVRYTTQESEGGNFLGRSTQRVANDVEIEIKRITPTFAREKMEPFFLAAEERPWFFMWDTVRNPTETFFGYTTNRPALVNEHQSFMACQIQGRGIA